MQHLPTACMTSMMMTSSNNEKAAITNKTDTYVQRTAPSPAKPTSSRSPARCQLLQHDDGRASWHGPEYAGGAGARVPAQQAWGTEEARRTDEKHRGRCLSSASPPRSLPFTSAADAHPCARAAVHASISAVRDDIEETDAETSQIAAAIVNEKCAASPPSHRLRSRCVPGSRRGSLRRRSRTIRTRKNSMKETKDRVKRIRTDDRKDLLKTTEARCGGPRGPVLVRRLAVWPCAAFPACSPGKGGWGGGGGGEHTAHA